MMYLYIKDPRRDGTNGPIILNKTQVTSVTPYDRGGCHVSLSDGSTITVDSITVDEMADLLYNSNRIQKV